MNGHHLSHKKVFYFFFNGSNNSNLFLFSTDLVHCYYDLEFFIDLNL
uniref:Uncharacterized protein n=1 Tax=Pleurostomum flabellatum TaxID=405751 RepID=A0A7T0Q5M7_9EUKA|nr:hypothetical protein J6731_mgp06 [Pleurostomum flabellatum]QPL15639.1 hypothetical protein [Pleurostomum flabellatum]